MRKHEICHHCGDNYIPKRRGVQRFCSNSCRSRYWFENQQKNQLPDKSLHSLSIKTQQEKGKKGESMSLAGVGNAAAGAAIVEIGKNMLTAKDNKPATKKDIQELKELFIERYLPINNLQYDHLGRAPYYDIDTNNVVYLFFR